MFYEGNGKKCGPKNVHGDQKLFPAFPRFFGLLDLLVINFEIKFTTLQKNSKSL